MKLELVRYGLGEQSTLGRFKIDGEATCFTIEDERRAVKIPGETCIPEGDYVITLRTEGGFHQRYEKTFPDMHEGMLWIRDVPGFEYILLHCGNTPADTAGCVLLGARPLVGLDGEFEVRESQVAYRHVYPIIRDALRRGEPVTIHIGRAA